MYTSRERDNISLTIPWPMVQDSLLIEESTLVI